MKTDLPYRPNVGICLINSEGKIFAGKRTDMPSDAWQMPQGGIDEDEKPLQAALRELEEETGVTSILATLLAVTPYWIRYDLPKDLVGQFWGGKYCGQRQKWYAYKFLGDDSQINIQTKHPEFSEWTWKTPHELIDAIVPFKRNIYTQVLTNFSQYLA